MYENDIINCIHLFLQQQLSSAQLTKLSHDLDFTFAVSIIVMKYLQKDIKQNPKVLDFTIMYIFKDCMQKLIHTNKNILTKHKILYFLYVCKKWNTFNFEQFRD